MDRTHTSAWWHQMTSLCATLPPPNSFTTASLVHYILVPRSISMTTLVHILGQYPDHCQSSSFCCPGWFQYADDALTCGMETVYSVCKKRLYALTIESFEQAEPNYLHTWNLLRQRSLVSISISQATTRSPFFLSFFVASRSGRVPLSSGMKLWLDELGSEGLEFC